MMLLMTDAEAGRHRYAIYTSIVIRYVDAAAATLRRCHTRRHQARRYDMPAASAIYSALSMLSAAYDAVTMMFDAYAMLICALPRC